MKKFYHVSHSVGQDSKIIVADTQYEAAGFYLTEEVTTIPAETLDRVQPLPGDHVVVVSTDYPCEGVTVKRTLDELFHELDTFSSPVTVINLQAPAITIKKERFA